MTEKEKTHIFENFNVNNDMFFKYIKNFSNRRNDEIKDFIEKRPLKDRKPIYETEHEIIYRESSLRILKFNNDPEFNEPLLIIPSLINKYHILDLTEECSFIKYMIDKGINVYLLDWGTPDIEHDHLTLDHYISKWMKRAVRKVCRDSKCQKVTLMGYCMGGTMSAIYAALYPENINGFISLAAPYDFSDDLPLTCIAQHTNVDLLVDSLGNMPANMLQAGFVMAQPTAFYYKMRSLYNNNDDEKRNNTFIALEQWLSDNIPFPKEVYREYIKKLYQQNELTNELFSLSDKKVSLTDIKVPVLNVIAEKDNIVHYNSAAILNEKITSDINDKIVIDAGHIGIIMGKRAKTAWMNILKWFLKINEKGV